MLTPREIQIVQFGKEHGQTKEQIIQAIQTARGIELAPAPVEPPKEGFISGVKESIQESGERLAVGFERERAGEQTVLETGAQLAGETIGTGIDIATEGAKAVIPDKVGSFVKERLKTIFPNFADSPLGKVLGFAGAKFEELSPRQQDNARAAIELLSVIPVVKAGRVAGAGVKATGEAVAPAVRETARVGAEVAERRLASQITQDALNITKPTLRLKEKTAAIEAGRGEVSRLTRETTLQPSAIDIKIAKLVEDVVRPSNNFVQNIDAVRGKIESASEDIGTKLRGNNTIFNRNQVRSMLNETKEESRVIFGTDKVLEKNYDAVIDEFMRVLDKHPKTLEGMWAARKEFDIVMKKKFPNVFEKFGGDTVRSNAILDVHKAANDFIGQKLPEGSAFREELLEISNMFTARKNIARSAADLVDVRLVDKVMTVIRANPITSFATGGIVTIGALTSLISAPIVLGTLLVVGAVKVGQKIFTARVLKEALSKGLRILEKTMKPDEKQAFEELIDQLDKAPSQ